MDVNGNCGSKVAQIAEEYGLLNLDQRITCRWQDKDLSLRDLETYVNGRILRGPREEAGVHVLDGKRRNSVTDWREKTTSFGIEKHDATSRI